MNIDKILLDAAQMQNIALNHLQRQQATLERIGNTDIEKFGVVSIKTTDNLKCPIISSRIVAKFVGDDRIYRVQESKTNFLDVSSARFFEYEDEAVTRKICAGDITWTGNDYNMAKLEMYDQYNELAEHTN